MKKVKQEAQERKAYVTIRSSTGRREKLETWRYWGIVGAMQWMGADRQTAYDAARWCMKAKPGESYALSIVLKDHISVSIKLEVIEDA